MLIGWVTEGKDEMKTLPIAAAALMLLVASSANASMTYNGRYLNGYSLNGYQLNGYQLNGYSTNGVTTNRVVGHAMVADGSRPNAVGEDVAREDLIGSIELIGMELPH